MQLGLGQNDKEDDGGGGGGVVVVVVVGGGGGDLLCGFTLFFPRGLGEFFRQICFETQKYSF